MALWRAVEMSCFLRGNIPSELRQAAADLGRRQESRFASTERFPEPVATDVLYATLRTIRVLSDGCSEPWWQALTPPGPA